MQIDIKKSWNQYIQLYLNYYAPPKDETEEVLPSLRDKLFLSILLFSFPICLLVYIPTIIISFTTNEFILGTFNSIALLFVLFIIMDRQQSIHSKKLFFSVVFYLLAVVLILFLGIEGPGMIILICTSVLITLYHSKIAGLISVASNALLFVLLLVGIDLDTNNFEYFHQFSLNTWIGVGINLIAFNTLVVLAVDRLLDELNDSLLKETDLQSLLMAESLKLTEAKQKAEESDRLKSAFLANMSHEIRTPMNGILGFLDLLADSNLKGEDRQIYIQIIQKSGDRLLNIIGEIVEMSKIESGAMEISLHGSSINDQLRNLYAQLKPEAESKGIWLELSNGLPDDEANVKTDEEKLRAILTKLVRNAIKFTNHGKIEFGYQLKTFDPEEEIQHPSELEFFVKDTGIGIPDDRKEAIFERFIQADISDVKARQGAGLGLSIAKNYVEMLGGTIWVESEQGKGSIFHFTHPYHVEIPELSPSEPNDWTENKKDGLNILIVDDDEASGILIEMILENVSKNIFFAKSGTEAIHICKNNPDIDLILMDIQMPVVTGHETTRKIREFNKEVVIIAQTAHALTGDREKAILAGCNDYISKPINKEELMLSIQKHFQNTKNISIH